MSLRPMSKRLLPVFSLRRFIALTLAFSSFFSSFWVYFYVWSKKVVQFHSFACSCSVSQHHLLKRLSFPHCIFILLRWRLIDHIAWACFWGLFPVLVIYVSLSVPVPYHFNCYSFVVYFEISDCNPSALFFFLKIVLAV